MSITLSNTSGDNNSLFNAISQHPEFAEQCNLAMACQTIFMKYYDLAAYMNTLIDRTDGSFILTDENVETLKTLLERTTAHSLIRLEQTQLPKEFGNVKIENYKEK